jgi:hypothetical protein
MLRHSLLLTVLCTVVACSSDPAEPAPEVAEPVAAEVTAEPEPVVEAQPAASFDGAWVVRTYTGKAAWLIEGDKLTSFEAGKETTLAFARVDDCTVSASDDNGMTTYTHYAWNGEALHVGGGNSGVVRSDGTMRVCISNVAFEWKDGACERHKRSMFGDKWETEPAECSFVDGVFEAKGSKLDVVGAALMNMQMKGNKAERKASFDEAKAAL